MRSFEEIEADTELATSLSDASSLLRLAAELDEVGTPQAEATACRSRGWAFYLQGDYPAALEYNGRATSLYEKLGDRSGVAYVMGNVGVVHFSTGDYPRALEHLHRALDLRQELGEFGGVANVSANIGSVYSSTGDFPAALEYYKHSLAAHEERGDRSGAAHVTCNLGILHAIAGDYPAALENFHNVLEFYEERGDRSGVATVVSNIGNVYCKTGDLPAALENFRRALTLREELGDRSGVALATGNIGNIYKDTGDYAAALEHYHTALTLSESLGDRSGAVHVKSNIAGTYIAMGSDADAQAALHDMDNMPIDQPMVRIARELLRAMLQERSGDLVDAVATLQQVLKEAQALGLRSQAADVHKALRELALKQNDLAAYVEHNNEYTRISEEINGKDTATKLAMQAKQREINVREREHEKQLAVLHSTLPKEVAERVARGEVVNDHFENASVIFLDIVGFTEISSQLSSQDVIELLDDVFSQCDTICKKHNVTKIKTIGDSYMCVSFDSVINAALCAVEMSRIQYTIQNTEFNLSMLQYRIGVHCGPVTAGVIGKERMQYDVWGDTVNVASRMESAGEPGRVHVSEAFASNLMRMSDKLQVTSDKSHSVSHSVSHNVSHSVSHEVSHSVSHSVSHNVSHSVSHNVPLVTRHSSLVTSLMSLVTIERGSIDIKGKGPMLTYWLEQR